MDLGTVRENKIVTLLWCWYLFNICVIIFIKSFVMLKHIKQFGKHNFEKISANKSMNIVWVYFEQIIVIICTIQFVIFTTFAAHL